MEPVVQAESQATPSSGSAPSRPGPGDGPAGLSPALLVIALAAFLAGIPLGAAAPLEPAGAHNPAENLWPQHLALSAVALLALAVGIWRWRTGRGRRLFLLTPLSRRARIRLGRTAGRAPLRLVLIVPAVAMVLYLLVRCGMQVTMGLDPDATINAWGGPTYLGAMYAHYLVAVLTSASLIGLIHVLMVPLQDDRTARRAAHTSS